MTPTSEQSAQHDTRRPRHVPGPFWSAPFLRAPEASRSIFLVMLAAASAPLAAGVVFFGWRALVIAALSVGTCVLTETAYFRVTRTPSLLGRSHAALTGLLLALTLPAFVPWYVPLAGGVFAIIVGKAIFGGVGHFLWQPALVGRLAVTVIFAPPLFATNLLNPPSWPVLGEGRAILGDVRSCGKVDIYRGWRRTPPPEGKDAFALPRPRETLRNLSRRRGPAPGSIGATLRRMPPAWDLICGAHSGGIGETCAVVILMAGLYLVYRNYVRGQLAGLFVLAAALVAAVAPVRSGPEGQWQWAPLFGPAVLSLIGWLGQVGDAAGWLAGHVWAPLHRWLTPLAPALSSEPADVGLTYVAYHLLCGELLLAGWFLATEMTSRPVTAPAQAIFGLTCGATAMLLRLYSDLPIPAYAAVLICNTFTPALDALIRPRVFGHRPWWRRVRNRVPQRRGRNGRREHTSEVA